MLHHLLRSCAAKFFLVVGKRRTDEKWFHNLNLPTPVWANSPRHPGCRARVFALACSFGCSACRMREVRRAFTAHGQTPSLPILTSAPLSCRVAERGLTRSRIRASACWLMHYAEQSCHSSTAPSLYSAIAWGPYWPSSPRASWAVSIKLRHPIYSYPDIPRLSFG